MPITFVCPCGKSLSVGDEYAGRRAKCPACGTVVAVPQPEPQFEVVDEEEEPQFEIVEDEPPQVPRARPATSSPAPDDDDEPPRKRKRARYDDEDDDDYEDEPRRRRKKKRRPQSPRRPVPLEYRDDYGGRGSDDLSAGDWLLCIFCSGIGCIVGIVRLVQGDSTGGKMIGLSLMFAVIWNVLRFALATAVPAK